MECGTICRLMTMQTSQSSQAESRGAQRLESWQNHLNTMFLHVPTQCPFFLTPAESPL